MSETKTQNNLLIPLILDGKYFKIKRPPKTEDENIKTKCDLCNYYTKEYNGSTLRFT